MQLKGYHLALILLSLLMLAGYIAFQIWWNTPLAPHMDLDFSARALNLNQDYVWYWSWIGAGFALLVSVGLGLLATCAYYLRQIARR
jgi:hypothetical protein